MERDIEKDRSLRFEGWTVIHFWGNEIKKRPEDCIKVIEEIILDIKLSEDIVDGGC